MKKSSRAVHRGLVLALTLGTGALACFVSSATVAGCGGDDSNVPPGDGVDASLDATTDHSVADSAPGDATPDHVTTDAGADAADAALPVDAAAPAHFLVTSGDGTGSTLQSYALGTGALEGTTAFSGTYGGGTAYNAGLAPFLLEQYVSVVARLDSTSPWKIDSSWNVLASDTFDGAAPYTNPYAVVVSAGTKAYVLRETRNVIDVIDPSQTVDGGGLAGSIDLTTLVQPGDTDGFVEMVDGFYDPTTQRLWVVLENINSQIYPLPCRATTATLIAVDTTTDKLISLGGTGPGGAYGFTFTDPEGAIFDAANERIVVAANGCQAESSPDGGAVIANGPILHAGVEAISLVDGTDTILFQDTAFGAGGVSGSSLESVGGTLAVAVFGGTGYVVDLAARTVKSTLTVTPSPFASDGNGHLYGLNPATDGGANMDVVEVTVADGSVKVLAAGAISAYPGGVALW